MEAPQHFNQQVRYLPTNLLQEQIKFCEHKDDLTVFSAQQNTALCNDCFFENPTNWGKTLTLKQASNANISSLQEIYDSCSKNLTRCKEMQQRMLNQESLEDEINKKVKQQFDMLKRIIDEQKQNA